MREASVGFQCPECVAQGRRTMRPARTAFGASRAGYAGYATSALIGLNVLFMVVGVAMVGLPVLFGHGLFGDTTRYQMVFAEFGPSLSISDAFVPVGTQPGDVFTGIFDGAWYRLFTAMFVHFGALHLLLNMWALWVLGRSLEAAFGPARFLALYLLSGLGGGVAVLLFAPNVPSAGASGAIFGLFAALFIALRRLGRDTSSVLPVIVINLVLTFTIPGISIAGHLGGLVAGAVVGAGLAYAPQRSRTAVQVAVLVATALLLVMLAAVAVIT
jgi:membrane associated rhomboid family serine protease